MLAAKPPSSRQKSQKDRQAGPDQGKRSRNAWINNNYDIDTTDGVKVLKESSWGLLRASNTGPNLTLRFEATTKKELKQIQKEFMDVLSKIMNK